uniref:Uncharacterized protein n=1 Tax=Rhizophora mucronata TaxID=61149 RepID=A0A2P2NKA5_RHIMU
MLIFNDMKILHRFLEMCTSFRCNFESLSKLKVLFAMF